MMQGHVDKQTIEERLELALTNLSSVAKEVSASQFNSANVKMYLLRFGDQARRIVPLVDEVVALKKHWQDIAENLQVRLLDSAAIATRTFEIYLSWMSSDTKVSRKIVHEAIATLIEQSENILLCRGELNSLRVKSIFGMRAEPMIDSVPPHHSLSEGSDTPLGSHRENALMLASELRYHGEVSTSSANNVMPSHRLLLFIWPMTAAAPLTGFIMRYYDKGQVPLADKLDFIPFMAILVSIGIFLHHFWFALSQKRQLKARAKYLFAVSDYISSSAKVNPSPEIARLIADALQSHDDEKSDARSLDRRTAEFLALTASASSTSHPPSNSSYAPN